MINEALILYDDAPGANEQRLQRLANFLGVPVRLTSVLGKDPGPTHGLCVLASIATIAAALRNGIADGFIRQLRKQARFLFVYGTAVDELGISALGRLTDGQITGVHSSSGDATYCISSARPDVTREFTNLSFGPVQNKSDFTFLMSSSAGTQNLVCIAELPFLVLNESDGCETFLLACTEILDIDEVTGGGFSIAKYFSRLLPAAMFFRAAFGNRCWHNSQRTANLIVDDPLLKSSYGHLKYQDLVAQMCQSNFSTTIAFIPFNHRRTERKTAQLFQQHRDKLSICVHGCNHTRAEFACEDVGTFNAKIQLASDRMRSHQAQTGVKYTDVMVFPQGRFSPEALRALKANNYIAAVNSSAVPTPVPQDLDFRVKDFLEVAFTRYEAFPLFLRRYPGGVENFAFDLFFGKPLLLVEHHSCFKDHGRRLIELVGNLNSRFALRWVGLQEALSSSYLEREVGHTTECKAYANWQLIFNGHTSDRRFVIRKRHTSDMAICGILADGQSVPYHVTEDSVHFELQLRPNTSVAVRVMYANDLPCAKIRYFILTEGGVWARRRLSEFRDNILSKNELLLRSAQSLAKRFKRDGEYERFPCKDGNGANWLA